MADDDKTERATAKRRGELRGRGDVMRSREVNTAVLFGMALLSLLMFGGFMFENISRIANFCFGMAGGGAMEAEDIYSIIIRVVIAFIQTMAPLFTAVVIAAVIGNAIQGSIIFTTEPLEPKWDRLNPISGFQSLFNIKDRVIDLVKSLGMLIGISYVCYLTMKADIPQLPTLLDLPVAGYFMFEMSLAFRLMKNVLMVYVVIAVIDYLLQRHRWEERNKMTKQEVKDEHRLQEGDPQVKRRIRRLQLEATRRRMMSMVPKADVVITNPTHFAVALMYDPENMLAPQVVAKGQDLIAKRIIEIAEEHKVTIYRDPPVARALYRAVEPGDPIPGDMFKAVAEILAQVYKITKKAGVKLRPSPSGVG